MANEKTVKIFGTTKAQRRKWCVVQMRGVAEAIEDDGGPCAKDDAEDYREIARNLELRNDSLAKRIFSNMDTCVRDKAPAIACEFLNIWPMPNYYDTRQTELKLECERLLRHLVCY
jgi:hypothetical protein